jgi:TolA-binding protein
VIRPTSCVLVASLIACGGSATPAVASLEAQLRQVQSEQLRQAHRIDLLESRVVLAEDSARLARQALVGVGPRQSVRIDGGDGSGQDEAIRSSMAPGSIDGPGDADDASSSPRPVVQATGRDRTVESARPFVVHDEPPLPVAPVPPPPDANRGAPRQMLEHTAPDDHALPATDAMPSPAHEIAPTLPLGGPSSARDPESLPAYEHAVALARGARCGDAIDALSAFLVRWPDHPYADHAMYWRGRCMLSSGDARRAASELEGLLRRFPSAQKAPDALYSLAECYRALGDAARARNAEARLQREFPESSAARRLRGESAPAEPAARVALERNR